MKVLVTGGAGFIGSHVLELLLRRGHEVQALDNFSDFYPRHWKMLNLDEVRRTGPAVCHEVDICDAASVDSVFAAFRPSAVIHLAADAGLRRSVLQPMRYARTNVEGTACLLESCRKYGVQRFVFASSSSVYGSASTVPFREEEKNLLPLSPYAVTKLAGEQLCYVSSLAAGMSVVCLRLFTVYGPRQRPDLAIRKFIEQIEAGEPVTMYGDGSSGRDYTYVDDIADGIVRALGYDCAFDIFNLGNSRPVSLREMIQVVERAVGSRAIVEEQPWNGTEAPLTWASIGKARELLGYQPSVDLTTGVGAAVDWWRRATEQLARRSSSAASAINGV